MTDDGFEIIGSVARDEVPKGVRQLRPSLWATLAQRIIDDHHQQRVTVLKVPNAVQLKRLRNGLAEPLRNRGYRLRAIIVRDGDEVRVFCELLAIQLRTGALQQGQQAALLAPRDSEDLHARDAAIGAPVTPGGHG